MVPGIATMAIGAFIGNWNSYLIPMLLINTPSKRPLPVMVAELSAVRDITTNLGATYAVEMLRNGALDYLLKPVERERLYGAQEKLEQLHLCYRRAYAAWQRSFFSGTLCGVPADPPRQPIAATAQQLAGLSRGQEAVRLLRVEAQGVAQGEKSPDAFTRLCAELVEKLNDSYRDLMELAGTPERFARLWDFSSSQCYLEDLEHWMDAFCGRTAEEFSDFENKQKVRQGVQYIQQHFREPLNMAVVSNHTLPGCAPTAPTPPSSAQSRVSSRPTATIFPVCGWITASGLC